MIVYERQREILKFLEQKRFATIKELSALVWSSESSVRRDVKALEQSGLVRQIYGGVVLAGHENSVIPVNLRDTIHSSDKDGLAKRATEHLYDGATVIMDGSSTVRRIMRHIGCFRDLKIITNNARIMSETVDPSIKIFCTGGLFLTQSSIFVGSIAEECIRGINADLLFFSSQAISSDGEISDPSEEETSLRKVMLSRAKKRIFLCDSSKIGEKRTFTLCTKDDVDEIICNSSLPWQ